MIFSKKQLIEWNLPDNGDRLAGVEVIEDTIIENRRWSILHQLIFRVREKFYRTSYCVGATEEQDECPWEFQEEVECQEVFQVEKLIKVWEAV